MAGLPYLVGERGPELIVPRAPGRVIPNHALGHGRSGPASPVAITVQVTGARGNAEIRQMVEAGVDARASRLRRPARRPGGAARRRSPLPRIASHGHRLPAGAVGLRRPPEDRRLPLAARGLRRDQRHRPRPGHHQRDRPAPLARRGGARPHAPCRGRRDPGADRRDRTVAAPSTCTTRRSSGRATIRPAPALAGHTVDDQRPERQQGAEARRAAGGLHPAPRRHPALRLWPEPGPAGAAPHRRGRDRQRRRDHRLLRGPAVPQGRERPPAPASPWSGRRRG